MRALEFKSKIKDNRISIPRRLRRELFAGYERPVRVVVYIEASMIESIMGRIDGSVLEQIKAVYTNII